MLPRRAGAGGWRNPRAHRMITVSVRSGAHCAHRWPRTVIILPRRAGAGWVGACRRQQPSHPAYSQPESPEPVDLAAVLADSMEHWVCETRFAWGQRRIADYQVPPPG